MCRLIVEGISCFFKVDLKYVEKILFSFRKQKSEWEK